MAFQCRQFNNRDKPGAQRSPSKPSTTATRSDGMLQLQSMIGNQGVTRLLAMSRQPNSSAEEQAVSSKGWYCALHAAVCLALMKTNPPAAEHCWRNFAERCLTPGPSESPTPSAGGPCVKDCERRFDECLRPPWWRSWNTPDPNQCLADRQACLRSCRATVAGCGEGICTPGPDCSACCQFHCPDNYSECARNCSPYR